MKPVCSLAATLRQTLPGSLLLALAYVVSALLVTKTLASDNPISPFWPPSGIVLAVVLLTGTRYWPGIVLGACIVQLCFVTDSLLSAVMVSAGALCEALYCRWWLCTRTTGATQTKFSPRFEQLNDFLQLIFAATAGTLIAAVVGSLSMLFSHQLAADQLMPTLQQWWQGNLLGVLLVTPLILVWRQPGWRSWFHSGRLRLLEWLALMLLTFLIGQIVYIGWWDAYFGLIAQSYWSLLCLVWAALRFGRHGVLLALVINGAQGLIGSALGTGYFADDLSRGSLTNMYFSYLLTTLTGISLSLISHERDQFVRTLKDQAELADSIVQSLPGLFYMLDENGRLLMANQRLTQETGYATEELLGRPVEQLLAPAVREQLTDNLQLARLHGEFEDETQLLRHDGKVIPYFMYARHCQLDGQSRLLGLAYDISERKQMEEALRSSEEMLQAAIGAAGDVIWDWDVVTGTFKHGAHWNQLLGYPADTPDSEIGHWHKRIHPDDMVTAKKSNATLFAGQAETALQEIRLRDRTGQWKWILSRCMVMQRDAQGKPMRIAGTLTDISCIKKQQQQLEQIAHFDTLTGVPNRLLLHRRLQQTLQTLSHARSTGAPDRLIAISYLDLDGFKEVNDNHGHDIGDSLLITITQRLRRILRECDTLARIGGDEFVILMAELESEAACHALLQRILKTVSAPVRLNDLTLQISASIGVTLYPNDTANINQLLRHADQAMYRAKQAGKNRYFIYDPDAETGAETKPVK